MKLYHATHKSLIPRILREGLRPGISPSRRVYLAKTPASALEQAYDDPPYRTWEPLGISYSEVEPLRFSGPSVKDYVVLEVSGLTRQKLLEEGNEPVQWKEDDDLGTSQHISPSRLRVFK